MQLLISQEKFDNARSRDLVPLKCKICDGVFKKTKHYIQNKRQKHDFCSKECMFKGQVKAQEVSCKQCNKLFKKQFAQIKKSPNHFCSQSCAGTYNNTHKTSGNRVSKLEKWLQIQLPHILPDLEFHFNRKDAINSELDIYIPSLKLAFELNGIFHYEPIYGQEQLSKIQNNDNRKFQACLERGIELCVIDTSKEKYFKESNSEKYLAIILQIMSKKFANPDEIVKSQEKDRVLDWRKYFEPPPVKQFIKEKCENIIQKAPISKQCSLCGSLFETNLQSKVFCKLKCRNTASQRAFRGRKVLKNKPIKPKKNCVNCNIESINKFCSRKCRNAHKYKNAKTVTITKGNTTKSIKQQNVNAYIKCGWEIGTSGQSSTDISFFRREVPNVFEPRMR